MYLCLDCLEVYSTPFEHCPKASCYGRVVEIDELILPAIIEFNKKGYATVFCCSGHMHSPYPYVVFDINEIPEKQQEIFINLIPSNWYLSDNIFGYDIHYQNKKGEKTAEGDNDIDTYLNLLSANLNLYKFALQLPDLKEGKINDNN